MCIYVHVLLASWTDFWFFCIHFNFQSWIVCFVIIFIQNSMENGAPLRNFRGFYKVDRRFKIRVTDIYRHLEKSTYSNQTIFWVFGRHIGSNILFLNFLKMNLTSTTRETYTRKLSFKSNRFFKFFPAFWSLRIFCFNIGKNTILVSIGQL